MITLAYFCYVMHIYTEHALYLEANGARLLMGLCYIRRITRSALADL